MGKKKSAPASRTRSTSKSESTPQSPPASTGSPDGKAKIGKKIKESRKKHRQEAASSPKLSSQFVLLFLTGVVVSVGAGIYIWYITALRDMIRTPLAVPRMISPNATTPAVDSERFWGSYRPGVYFGLKTRSPMSPVFGLMWMTQFTGKLQPDIRSWCDQHDGLQKYGWLAHDGINFGMHEVVDQQYIISTDFVKKPGGSNGGDWTARIQIKQKPGAPLPDGGHSISLFTYMALDGQGQLAASLAGGRVAGIRGRTDELGSFQLSFSKFDKSLGYVHHYLVTHAPSIDLLKETLMQGLMLIPIEKTNLKLIALAGTRMPENMPESRANFIVSQITVGVPFEMEVAFESGSVIARTERLGGSVYKAELEKHLNAFHVKFDDIFKLKSKGYNDNETDFAKAALSNMIGSIGYFHGSSIVQSKHSDPMNYWNAPLYTAVPSRSFFPRGFLWDEGFHNILISRWNRKISMDIIGHWFDLINIEGWIPREQILGHEAVARVPREFVIQHSENANPPTFFLPLRDLIRELIASDDPQDREYLEKLFPRLTAWYNWFNVTQSGSILSSYRWRGRNSTTTRELNPKTLTSGLDDYPRATHPTDEERHIDLRCWMALASGVMADLARTLNKSWEAYEETRNLLTDNKRLDELHWSEKSQRYSDFGLHSESVKLQKPTLPKKILQPGQHPPPPVHVEEERVVLKEPTLRFVDSEFGYVSLFPFLLKIIAPNSPKLGKVLTDLYDSSLLWTPFGLRSLAKSSPTYKRRNTEHDPPYWRGSIWINVNYLALGALHHYSALPGPHMAAASELYEKLRENIVRNMYNQYQWTGYIWEQYDDVTGEGKGSHPFTGWSALVVAIMAEQY